MSEVHPMKFTIMIDNKKKSVEVIPKGPKLLKVLVEGKEYEVAVDAEEAPPIVAAPPLDDETAYIAETMEYSPSASDRGMAEPRPPQLSTSAEPRYAQLEIRSPLPGIVSSIEVEEGSGIKKGDVLAYIESMKMMNDIVAPQNGRVRSIKKRANDKVDIGEVLMVLEVPGE